MANSNWRMRKYETVHHLVSRIAHRVYFLEDEERSDFLEMARRAAEFTGVQLLGWCIMGNHFHLLVFLPEPPKLGEPEVLRRYGALKGAKAMAAMEATLTHWRLSGDLGEARASEWLDKQQARMYDVGSFMKIIKQWFTEEYNRRKAHRGTLWESAYFDRVVKRTAKDMSECLAYIHLNPIRAAATDRFDGYIWSSYTAFRKGESIATAGMRFVYGEPWTVEEIADRHQELMGKLLEKEKLRRAEEIARKRAVGYEVPADPLTTEAMIAQRAAHIAEVQNSLAKLHDERVAARQRKARRDLQEKEIISLLTENPGLDIPSLAERLGVALSTAYNVVGNMKKKGILERDRRKGLWNLRKQV